MTQIKIKDSTIFAESSEGYGVQMPLSKFLDAARPAKIETGGIIMPDGFKLSYSQGDSTIWAYEIPPRIYSLKWISKNSAAKYGRGTKYRTVRIACPYVVILAVFKKGLMGSHSECFFRTKPLKSEHDELLYPALLNCSKFNEEGNHPLSWICTQKMDSEFYTIANPALCMRAGLKALLSCLWDTGFNFSSESHEGNSWFSASKHVDKRIATVEAWQQATKKDPLFVLDVPWLPVGRSLRQVAERIFSLTGANDSVVRTAADVERIVCRSGKIVTVNSPLTTN